MRRQTWTDAGNDVSMRASKLLAWNLRRLRVGHGLSQKRLAANTEIARGYLARIERGLENPTLEMLDRLATALSISLAEFFVAPGKADVPPEPLRGGRPRKSPGGHVARSS
jgi:transcriptional regulator with XRE-family HTH domain